VKEAGSILEALDVSIIFLIILAVPIPIFLTFWILTPRGRTGDSDITSGNTCKVIKAIGCIIVIMLAEVAAFAVGGLIAVFLSRFMSPSLQTNIHLFAVGIFTGSYLGWNQARRKHLPRNAVLRYIPPLIPIFWVILTVITRNFKGENMYYGAFTYYSVYYKRYKEYEDNILLASVLYPCVSFVISFTLGCIYLKRRSIGKWFLVTLVAVVAGLAYLPVWRTAQYKSLTFSGEYRGATVVDDIDFAAYHPAYERGKLAKL
jgi:ABC-type phosphate transport system permease subunit